MTWYMRRVTDRFASLGTHSGARRNVISMLCWISPNTFIGQRARPPATQRAKSVFMIIGRVVCEGECKGAAGGDESATHAFMGAISELPQ